MPQPERGSETRWLHLQTVNSRHSRIKDLLRRFPGVATKVLDGLSPVVP